MKPKRLLFLFLIAGLRMLPQQAPRSPRPAWVNPVSFDYSRTIARKDIREGYFYFLTDKQVHVSSKTYYNHYAVKIFDSEGVDSESKINLEYHPLYQSVRLHAVLVHRNGGTIDKLTDARYARLQREEQLENNLYGGKTTINLILSDIRVGDVIEYEYSIIGDNPIFENKFYYSFYLNREYDKELEYVRVLYNPAKPLNIHYFNDSLAPAVSSKGQLLELIWDLKNVKGLKTEPSMPASTEPYNLVELSEYSNWAEVAQWGVRVFATPDRNIGRASEFLKQTDTVGSLEKKIMHCLRFTQDNIRYFGIEIGENSHRPKSVEKIMQDGYGDCKDKTTLFCFFLHKLGVKATPVLVNSSEREGILHSIPSPRQFDHVITLVELEDKWYFFDPTISFQGGSLEDNFVPDYGYGLALNDSTRTLIKIISRGIFETRIHEYFNVKNMAGRCMLDVRTDYLGGDADDIRRVFYTSNTESIKKDYLQFYEKNFGEIDSNALTYNDYTDIDRFTVSENYTIKNIWSTGSTSDEHAAEFAAHGISTVLNKIDLDAKSRHFPLRIEFPSFTVHKIDIALPESWNVDASDETISNEFLSFHFSTSYSGDTVHLLYSLKIKSPIVPPEKYQAFKADVEKIKRGYLNYSITHNVTLEKKLAVSHINSTAVLFAAMFSLLCLFLFIYALRFFRPAAGPLPAEPLGGWLIVVLIGLFTRLIFFLYLLTGTGLFDNNYWVTYTDAASGSYMKGANLFLFFRICTYLLLAFMSVFIIIQFIKRRRGLPRLMVLYLVLYFALQITDLFVGNYYFGDHTTNDLWYNTIRLLIFVGIWIPYFTISRRVKETFVL